MSVFTKPPVLLDGETAFADDVNILANRAEAAFDLVEDMANGQAVAASLFVDAAEAWAVTAENVEVEVGKYSSLHYSLKSSASAIAAAGSASTASTDAGTASTHAGTASTQAGIAQKWATEAEDTPVSGGLFSSYHWAQKAEEYVVSAASLISDTIFGVSWDGVTTTAPSKNAVYDQMILKANIASPALTGNPTAPTQASTDDSTRVATTAHVKTVAVQKTGATGSAVIPAGTTAEQDGTPAAGYMRFNTEEEKFEGYDGTEWASLGGGGLEWVIASADYTTETGVGTMLDTDGATKTVTLHATPAVGDTIAVADLKGTFADYNVTIDRNSMLIMGEAEDLILDVKNQRVTLVYSGATDGWIITELEPSPLLTQHNRTVPGLDLTGGVLGFDMSKTGANQITVTKGWTIDSTGLIPLPLTADTALAIPAVANTIYHIFVVRLVATGLFTVEAYTTEAAVASDTDVDAFRWIGYWVTNGSTECRAGAIKDGELWWERFSENTINAATNPPTGITTAIDISTYVPVSRAESILFGGLSTTAMQLVALSFVSGSAGTQLQGSGNNPTAGDIAEWNAWGTPPDFIPVLGSNLYWGEGTYANSTGTLQLAIHAVKLRR